MTRLTFRNFRPDDGVRIIQHPNQWIQAGQDTRSLTIDDYEHVAARGPAWSAVDDVGTIWWCGGFAERVAGLVAVAWSVLADGLGVERHLQMTRFVRARVAESPLVRIEAMIAEDAERRGAKWAAACGLSYEGRFDRHDGSRDAILCYARVLP